MFTNDIFTIEPGRVEMEFGVNTGSVLTTTPTVLKYEPDTKFFLFRQTEFSFPSDTMTWSAATRASAANPAHEYGL